METKLKFVVRWFIYLLPITIPLFALSLMFGSDFGGDGNNPALFFTFFVGLVIFIAYIVGIIITYEKLWPILKAWAFEKDD